MRHSLENHLLRIEVESKGAELASLVKKATQMEYMWQADPAVWGSHAPVLFPIIGVLKDGKTRINGQEYSIPKHGMVRHNEDLELYSQTEDRITFRLKCNEETRKHYPYNFEFLVTYRLRNEHVIVYHEIYNEDTQPIYFCLGGHPAFRVPFLSGRSLPRLPAAFRKRREQRKSRGFGRRHHRPPYPASSLEGRQHPPPNPRFIQSRCPGV
jgi:galactose mutarotase-like enzyme